MIEELSVRNFALIDSLTLSLENGFTVLTGETGAGKSIIVGSLSFLLGAKADADMIRSGCDEAGVSALITVAADNRDALEWLRLRNMETDDSRIVVRRAVKSSGRSSIYIQNSPVTRGELAEFMGFLFDLHGQHNHESLLRKETHRVYLDRYAGLEDEAAAFYRVFTELAEKRKTLESFFRAGQDRETRLEILKYAVEEIAKAAPRNGEIRELEAETQRLGDFEKLSIHVNTAASAFFDEEPSALSLVRRAKSAMESAGQIDSALEPLLKRMDDLYYEAEDLGMEFRNYRDSLSYDPDKLEEAEERLALLYRLRKKYHPAAKTEPISDEEGILAYRVEAEAEIENLSNAEENLDKLKAEIASLEKDIFARAAALSAKRSDGAKKLSEGITEILAGLGMPNARFSVQVSAKPGEGGGFVCGPWGADNIEFMIAANPGEPLKELARIASGGELSRVMLAIKTILCGKQKNAAAESDAAETAVDAYAETLVFDEIDTGIGGEVALAVGEYLSRIGKAKQIFCVTHLASIAVRADHHLKVEKKVVAGGGKERTVTGVTLLDSRERRQEIARMLAGESGEAALAHADELLAKYGKISAGIKPGAAE